MNCEQFSSLLELYDGGGLNEAERAEMNAHAKTCAHCQMLLDLRALQAGGEEVPQSAKNAWRAAVQNEEAAHMDVQKKKAPAWRRWAAVAAAVVFVAVGAEAVSKMDLTANQSIKNSGSASYSAVPGAYGSMTGSTEDAGTEEAAYGGVSYGTSTSRMAAGANDAADMTLESSAEETAKIIKTATLTIKTQGFDDDLNTLRDVVEALGGRVESETVSGDKAKGALRSASLTLRIPEDKLDEFLQSAQGVSGRVTSSSVSSQDVSDSYYDTQSRLDTQKAKLERLNQLMAQATDVADLIEIESAVSDTQYMIDAYTGQLSGYDSQISYSAVNVSLKEETAQQAAQAVDTSFGARLRNGVESSIRAIGEFFGNAAIFIVMAAPWLAMLAVAAAVVILILKGAKNKKIKGEK